MLCDLRRVQDMITKCPHCNTKFKVRDEYKGRKTKCPKCQQTFTIQEFGGEPMASTGETNGAKKKVEVCAKCGRTIGELEKSYPFKGIAVCIQCNKELRSSQHRQGEGVKETSRPVWSQQSHISVASQRNPLGWLGTTIGALIFFIVVIPLMRVTCNQITRPGRIKKASKKVMTEILAGLPIDGAYSADAGTGGEYRDPIHGFFEVQPPLEAQISSNRENTTMKLPPGSPNSGKTVRCSRVKFEFHGNAVILVNARETFHPTFDLEELVRGIGPKLDKGSLHKRRITIDGVDGVEVAGTASYNILHIVKYKKYGLDHTVTLECDWANRSGPTREFVRFLCSYRSLNQQQVSDGTKPEKP